MNPFDLPGPAFLALWLMGLSVVIPVMLWLRSRAEHSGAGGRDLDELARRLHPTEVGYLVGGVERAIEAAIAGLHHRWMLELRDGKLYPTGAAGTPFRGTASGPELSAVERYVMECASRSGTSIELLLAGTEGLDIELRQRLEAEGLLLADPAHARLRAALPGLAWLAFGALKLLVGLSRGKPVGFLFLLLIGWGVAIFVITRASRLTACGQRLIEQLKGSSYGLEATAASAPDQLVGPDMTLAYALFGTSVIVADLAAVMPSHQRMIAEAATSSSCGSGCGSSCGGGCGGCGGCS